ncbi:MAG: hypothetical protein KDD83_28630, partial [Caldilineaceae bacterium]|nr:hypothetical protein [Caldilineaceae bacterium]
FAWDTSNLADGEQTLTIQATDAAGNVSAPASWHTILDNTAPAISIDTASEPGQPYRDQTGRWRVPLLGTVTDPVAGVYPGSGVEQVDVLLQGAGDVDGLGWQPATLAPGLWSLDYALPEVIGARASEPTGAYTVTVRATDRVSNTTAAPDYVTVRVQLDVSGPEVSLSHPLSVTQLITTDRLVAGTVSDAGDVATVQVNFTPGAQIGAL